MTPDTASHANHLADHLHALLRRLNLRRDTILPYSSTDSRAEPMTLDKYLELLEKQHYLEKVGEVLLA